MTEWIILTIPFAGTALGAAMVFLLKNGLGSRVKKLLLGFASGVMIAASVWSLLIPSIEMAEAQGVPAAWKKTTMMVFAVTLHNIPEGMSVGVASAGAMMAGSGISTMGALALAIGIAIQNFPEGAIVSMPLCGEGMSKRKAFLCGILSGIVEPVGGFITILIAGSISPVLPYLLSFAAGAMIYVVVEELIPESQSGEHTNIGTIGTAVGFALMMVLDVALG